MIFDSGTRLKIDRLGITSTYHSRKAEMLLQVATDFCPDAIPEIQRAIKIYVRIKGNDYDRGEKTARTITR